MSQITAEEIYRKIVKSLEQKNGIVVISKGSCLQAFNKNYSDKAESICISYTKNNIVIITIVIDKKNKKLGEKKRNAVMREHMDFFYLNTLGGIEKDIHINPADLPDIEEIVNRTIKAYAIAVTMN